MFSPSDLSYLSSPLHSPEVVPIPSANTWLGMPHSSPRQLLCKPYILTHLEQLAMWMAGPRQSRPPQRGWGELQTRARHKQEPELSPSKCSHGCHGDHGPKPPSLVIFRTCRHTSGTGPSYKAGIGKARGPGDVGLVWGVTASIGQRLGGTKGSHRTRCDVLGPEAHVGAVLECAAALLLPVPAAVRVPRPQACPARQRS